MRRYLLVLAACLGCVCLAIPASASSPQDIEQEFISKINSERVAAGLSPLTTDGQGTEVARRHSQRMIDAGRIHHNQDLPKEMDGWTKLGENVGRGPTTGAIHDAFMRSEEHRHNILDAEFTSVGVGVVMHEGYIWVTEVFILRETPSPPAPAETVAPPQPNRPRVRVAGVKTVRPVQAPPPSPPQVSGDIAEPTEPLTSALPDEEPATETVLSLPEVDLGRSPQTGLPAAAAAGVLVMMVAHLTRWRLSRSRR